MIKFNDIKYERPHYESVCLLLKELLQKMYETDDAKSYIDSVIKINDIQRHIEEMYDYADIRNMRNLNDEYFKSEILYWNEFKPKFDLLFLPFYKEINHSKWKQELLKVMPNNFFKIIEYQLRITSSEIAELQKQENELKTRYRNLNRTMILFEGEEKTIGAISGLFVSKDRSVRKKAHDAINDFYYSRQQEYDSILCNLIHIRNAIAKKLGFSNYVQYSLYKLKRLDYDYNDICQFRNHIIQYIIPLCNKLRQWQKEELEIAKLEYYDTIFFKEMPKVKLCGNDLLTEFKRLLKQIDLELSSVFDRMFDNGYIDLEQRNDKVNFGITNYLVESCLPVITGNYKNCYLDVQTTSHEIGHLFQKYCASITDQDLIVSPLLKYPTMEVAEMFSYSMELMIMQHAGSLFEKDDYKKYCFMKIYHLVSNLPYICLVDEFQERIYSKEDVTQQDIRKIWLELVNRYQLEQSNQGHINLDSGGYFYRQSHIYLDPFYYIDYALSYFGAFAIWNGCIENIDLFKKIGSIASYYSFHDLINVYNMPNPFDENTVKVIAKKLEEELKSKRLVKRR